MKKVINHKVYSTETAERVHIWDNGRYGNDFSSCSESLYKTKKGAWFIYGEGGPMSKYSKSCGNNSWCGGEDIEVLTIDKAVTWLADHDGEEVLEKYFANEIEEA